MSAKPSDNLVLKNSASYRTVFCFVVAAVKKASTVSVSALHWRLSFPNATHTASSSTGDQTISVVRPYISSNDVFLYNQTDLSFDAGTDQSACHTVFLAAQTQSFSI